MSKSTIERAQPTPAQGEWPEVISPSRARMDRVTKFTAYEAAGVPEYWIVNPHARTIEVFTLSNGEYGLLGEYTDAEVVQSVVLKGIDLVASSLFA